LNVLCVPNSLDRWTTLSFEGDSKRAAQPSMSKPYTFSLWTRTPLSLNPPLSLSRPNPQRRRGAHRKLASTLSCRTPGALGVSVCGFRVSVFCFPFSGFRVEFEGSGFTRCFQPGGGCTASSRRRWVAVPPAPCRWSRPCVPWESPPRARATQAC